MPNSYSWDAAARRYRSPVGTFLSTGRALASLESDLRGLVVLTDNLTDDLRSGRLSLEAWRFQMMDVVKHVQMGAATLAKGGRAQMTDADYGRVGQLTRAQYQYLEEWTQEIARGDAPLDGRLTSRARLYVAAARPTYVAVRGKDVEDAGFDQERSILGNAEHCATCIAQDALGWQPRGQMIPIGQRECGNNDKCPVEFRNSTTGQVLAA